jgi:hypothetical protein
MGFALQKILDGASLLGRKPEVTSIARHVGSGLEGGV